MPMSRTGHVTAPNQASGQYIRIGAEPQDYNQAAPIALGFIAFTPTYQLRKLTVRLRTPT